MRLVSLLVVCSLSHVALADDKPPAEKPATPEDKAKEPAKTPDLTPDADKLPLTTTPMSDAKPKNPQPADPVSVQTPWYKGQYANNRFTHIAITAVVGLYYLSSNFINDIPHADPSGGCRWCSPPGIDRAFRNHLKWGNMELADTLSTIGAYGVAPLTGITLLILSDKNASATRLIDDLLPVAETIAFTGVTTAYAKWAFARERPYAYYGTRAIDSDAFSSFWSGHSTLGFAITTAAGSVAHHRRYWTEPYIWAAGITVSLGVEYLRMAADRHYFTDVLVGGGVGILAGWLVPKLMDRQIKIIPMPNGVQVVGTLD